MAETISKVDLRIIYDSEWMAYDAQGKELYAGVLHLDADSGSEDIFEQPFKKWPARVSLSELDQLKLVIDVRDHDLTAKVACEIAGVRFLLSWAEGLSFGHVVRKWIEKNNGEEILEYVCRVPKSRRKAFKAALKELGVKPVRVRE